jgi:hypothetical protein
VPRAERRQAQELLRLEAATAAERETAEKLTKLEQEREPVRS